MLAFAFSLLSILFCLFAVYWCWWKWFLYDGSYTRGEPHIDCMRCEEPHPIPSEDPEEANGQHCKVCNFKFGSLDYYNAPYELHTYHYGHFWKPWTWKEIRIKHYIIKSPQTVIEGIDIRDAYRIAFGGVKDRDVSNE